MFDQIRRWLGYRPVYKPEGVVWTREARQDMDDLLYGGADHVVRRPLASNLVSMWKPAEDGTRWRQVRVPEANVSMNLRNGFVLKMPDDVPPVKAIECLVCAKKLTMPLERADLVFLKREDHMMAFHPVELVELLHARGN